MIDQDLNTLLKKYLFDDTQLWYSHYGKRRFTVPEMILNSYRAVCEFFFDTFQPLEIQHVNIEQDLVNYMQLDVSRLFFLKEYRPNAMPPSSEKDFFLFFCGLSKFLSEARIATDNIALSLCQTVLKCFNFSDSKPFICFNREKKDWVIPPNSRRDITSIFNKVASVLPSKSDEYLILSYFIVLACFMGKHADTLPDKYRAVFSEINKTYTKMKSLDRPHQLTEPYLNALDWAICCYYELFNLYTDTPQFAKRLNIRFPEDNPYSCVYALQDAFKYDDAKIQIMTNELFNSIIKSESFSCIDLFNMEKLHSTAFFDTKLQEELLKLSLSILGGNKGESFLKGINQPDKTKGGRRATAHFSSDLSAVRSALKNNASIPSCLYMEIKNYNGFFTDHSNLSEEEASDLRKAGETAFIATWIAYFESVFCQYHDHKCYFLPAEMLQIIETVIECLIFYSENPEMLLQEMKDDDEDYSDLVAKYNDNTVDIWTYYMEQFLFGLLVYSTIYFSKLGNFENIIAETVSCIFDYFCFPIDDQISIIDSNSESIETICIRKTPQHNYLIINGQTDASRRAIQDALFAPVYHSKRLFLLL